MHHEASEPGSSARPTRRSLARGAAWAVPTIVVATASPALAASSACIAVNPAVNSSTTLNWDSGWTEILVASDFVDGTGSLEGTADTFAPKDRGRCNNGSPLNDVTPVANAKVGERDPRYSTSTFAYERALCIAPGTYTLTYEAAAFRGNPVTAYMDPSIRNPSGVAVSTSAVSGLAQQVVAQGFVKRDTGDGVNPDYVKSNMGRTQFGFRFVAPSQGTYTFRFTWTFSTRAKASTNSGELTPTYNAQCRPTYANDIAVEAPIVTRVS